ncbi:hypothetical protein A2609_03110 [Candidatus Kaiserbacteria bacterium RIFOXYD1_FULL_47_14]|uniref:Uncharacterized protein n=1 Tax=Candidatus Kaiserbacteria bacterium RIFOXYD1_FULL_47_14 TaxID=1798533 RepID=A0A1F6G3R4_9BACT|nr:MAG: hypothetical protein A2609_03110 [Candidatus Kaiserbacteria bacterium RIFOXYD1_FULL_47_14]
MLFPKFFYKAFEIIRYTVLISTVLFLFGIVLKMIVEPFSLTITILVVLFLTIHTFLDNEWTNALLSVAGITLYAASWPITNIWGYWLGACFWSSGILLWFAVVYRTFSKHPMIAVHPAADRQNQDEEGEEIVPAEVEFTIGKPVTYIPVAVSGGRKINKGTRGQYCKDDTFNLWTGTDGDSLVHRFYIPEAVLTVEKPVTYVHITIKGKTENGEWKGSMFPRWEDGGLIGRFYGLMSEKEINPVENPGSVVSDYREWCISLGSYNGYFTPEDAVWIEFWLRAQGANKKNDEVLSPEE